MTILKDIYRSIFGKDYGPVWRQFAKESNGTYFPGAEEKVEFPYKDHRIIFDTYTHYTVVGGSGYKLYRLFGDLLDVLTKVSSIKVKKKANS